MKLSKYIASLQKFLKENGDLDCYYAIDDEGNGYQQVNWAGTKMLRYKHSQSYRPDLLQTSDIEEYDYDPNDCIPVCVIN